MKYQEVIPGERLKSYIKCYYIYESDAGVEFEDTVFPSGLMEMIFNLGEGTWETLVNNKFQTTPKIELWGQIVKPLAIRSKGKNIMFGIKFFPHTAAYFLKDEITVFNNQVSDLSDVFDSSVKDLHARLLETAGLNNKIELVESFFTQRLPVNENASNRITEVGHIITNMKKKYADENVGEMATKYGISPRYLHKLVSQYTGLSPKFLNKINRFQQSLKLITDNKSSLTSIAYDCGYFDQSHFIKDFKSFTGLTPSAYLENKFPANQFFLQ